MESTSEPKLTKPSPEAGLAESFAGCLVETESVAVAAGGDLPQNNQRLF